MTKTSYQSTLRNIPEERRNRVFNLYGKYCLSILAPVLPRFWEARFVGRVNSMSKMTGNGKGYFSRKIMANITYVYKNLRHASQRTRSVFTRSNSQHMKVWVNNRCLFWGYMKQKYSIFILEYHSEFIH